MPFLYFCLKWKVSANNRETMFFVRKKKKPPEKTPDGSAKTIDKLFKVSYN